ncbi:MATE family efflux transporter [Winogradskyella sp. PC-19]|uniref:MATE family efflux transporter n=1 Tax=unclassified Winogradskyella TaxID=2615021 RepID=UPI000B3C81D5|nr:MULTISPECIES: MATE family efflux transporter [unclassified Winogradskyella]ARV09606.1 MATE family efflux transporter [Winogradskyella sp. PC-19]RZN74689.1 MAG: MATE family efflux transporter [Winogradskyella sp.]
MAKVSSQDLGTEPIGKLLVKQAVPASIGILVMSLNILVDTIFVGNWIGATAIAAINVVLPVSFFIAALGMAIGIGGSSIISRALGADNKEKALKTFGNQLTLTFVFTVTFAIFGLLFVDTLIPAFGGKGSIFAPAKIYYEIILYGVPILGFVMMGNSVIRAEGKPKFAMYAMLIPSIGNLLFDYIFINILDYGMAGAAWATTGSYIVSFLFILWYFFSKNSELKLDVSHLGFDLPIVKEIGSLGSVTLARQAVVSVTFLLVNNALYNFGGETSVTAYAIVGRMSMFALFPIYGITQGFIPIAGYNYGAKKFDRVKEVIYTSIKYATVLAIIIFIVLMVFPEFITKWFTTDQAVTDVTPNNMRWAFAAIPILSLQLVGAAYFQAIGKALPALILTLTRQAIFFIPLMYIMPIFFGELGIWISFSISDVLSTIVTYYFLRREVKLKLETV